jgi:flavin-dependent dehydrogenase
VRSDDGPDRILVSCDRSIFPAYGWIFPLGGGVYNTGVILHPNGNGGKRASLRALFEAFFRAFPPAQALMRTGRFLTPLRAAPLRCGLRGSRFRGPGNVLVAGEACATTVPYMGAGIGDAMESGEQAADAIHRALASGSWDRLGAYETYIESELRPLVEGFETGEKWVTVPWLNDLLARRLRNGAGLLRFLRRILEQTADPRTMFSLRGILGDFC